MPSDRPVISQSELDRLRFAAIIASSDDAIVSKDLDGTIRSWNMRRAIAHEAAKQARTEMLGRDGKGHHHDRERDADDRNHRAGDGR